MEQQRRARVGQQVHALAAFVIGEECEAVGIHALEQHDARGRLAVGAHGGQRHGVWLGQLGLHGFVEPRLELANRVGSDVGFGKRAQHVVAAQVCELGHVAYQEGLRSAHESRG